MAWKNDYIKINQFTRPGHKLTRVNKLVLHYTANHGATARNHHAYFGSNLANQTPGTSGNRFASAHIFVDKTEALCIIPLNEVTYHANDGTVRGVEELKPNANFLSISVEMCQERDGSFHADTIRRTELVMAELCKQFKLDPVRDIVRHYDVTRKNCPAPWVSNSKLFTDFKNKVKALNELEASGTTYIVKSGDTLSEIALRFRTTTTILQQLNNISNPNQIKIGQVIKLPSNDAAAPQPNKKESEPFMLEKAIVINTFADYPAAERVAKKINAPIYTREVAEKGHQAKELIVCGGFVGKLKATKITDLSGRTLFDTFANIGQYLK